MPNALPEGEVPFSDDGTSLSDLSTDTPTRNLQDVVAIQRHTALEAHARMDASGRSTVGVSEAGSPFPTQAPVVGAAAAVIGSEFMARGAEGIRGGAAAGSSARAGDTGGGGGVAPRCVASELLFFVSWLFTYAPFLLTSGSILLALGTYIKPVCGGSESCTKRLDTFTRLPISAQAGKEPAAV